jgi:hypothetical protein
MKKLAAQFKKDKSEEIKQKLKDLTAQKKKLEKELNPPEEIDETEEDLESELMMEGYDRFQRLAGIRLL